MTNNQGHSLTNNDEYVKLNSIVQEQEVEEPQEKQEEQNSNSNNERSRSSSESSKSRMSISTSSEEDTAESKKIMDGTPTGNLILRRSTRQIRPTPRYNDYALMSNIMNTSEPMN